MSDNSNHNDMASSDFDKDSEGKFRSGIIKKTENFDLFISYKRDNGGDHGQQIAERLYRELTRQGLKVWLDNEEIGYSRDFEVRIEEAILHSKKFMCILSPAWLASENCRYEFLKAISFEKRIIPVHYREFRGELLQQKIDGILTEDQWRRLDRPQELNFSKEEYFQNGFRDLLSVCALKDRVTARHTKILYESYYWNKFDRPDGMLLRGIELTKTKRLKNSCNGDQESPSFAEIQNEFLAASEKFVTEESSRKRKVFISFSPAASDLAKSINLELRLQDISTWFENTTNQTEDQSDFIESILNSETILHCVSDAEEEDDLVLAFARSNDKRILYLTNSKAIYEDHQKKGEKGYFYWEEGLILEDLITSIKGDAEYLGIHGPLLDSAYVWLKSGKSDSKLLPLKEAKVLQEWYQVAEAQGSEPKPNNNMVDFVERSIVKGEAMANRKRMAFWTILLGSVLLVGLGIAVFYQNKELKWKQKQAKRAQTEATKALSIAEEAKKEAIEKDSLSKIRIAIAQEKIDKITEQQELIENQLKDNKESLAIKMAQIDSQNVILEEVNERTIALRADSTKMAKDQSALKADLERQKNILKDLKEEANTIRNASLGRTEARSAFHYIRFGFDSIAKQKADSAVHHLQQGQAQVQIQPLYDVYKELIDENHPISADAHQKSKPLLELLEDLNTKPDSLTPPSLFDRTPSSLLTRIKTKYLSNAELYSTHCYNQDSSVIAIGMKDGNVSLYKVNNAELIESFKYHSHRITSLVFNPENSILAVTGIDERFTIFPLGKHYKRNPDIDIIEQNTETRINQLFFLGNDILICLDSHGAKAWGINVNEIKKLAVNEK